MAKKKVAKAKRRSDGKWSRRLLSAISFIAMIVFLPTSIFLFFSMMPTLVAGLVDRSGKGTRALTVGAMNLAGSTPFLFELWTGGHTAQNALALISNPRTIVVIYCAAGIGYLIDWAMSGIVATVMIQRSASRLKEIKKKQAELVERWGEEVTGLLPLDAYGFPFEKPEETSAAKGNGKAGRK
jgi:hypothetical protein